MKSIVIWALVALNGVLLAELVSNYIGHNTAMAARGRRPDIVMIPGRIIGGNSSVVYIIDSANRRLGAVALDNTGKALSGLPPQELERIFEDDERPGR
jgi:hypothetical protein